MARKILFSLFIFTIALWGRVHAQQWVVPDDQKGVVSPFIFTPETQKKGEAVYLKNCVSCHGTPGQKNWAKITPEPGDPASEKFQLQTDGEFFYRVSNGKVPMPQFMSILSEEERWNVISYIRSFHPNYKQPKPGEASTFKGTLLKLSMEYAADIKKLKVKAVEVNKDKQEVPFKGATIQVSVKRYFGSMSIGDAKATGETGVAFIDFDETLPGDRNGNVELTAQVVDRSGQLKSTPVTMVLPIGTPTDKPSLIATRDWWTVRSQAPVWVILVYSLAVIIAWGFILYIISSVIGMRKIT
jgi:hypothetical protein